MLFHLLYGPWSSILIQSSNFLLSRWAVPALLAFSMCQTLQCLNYLFVCSMNLLSVLSSLSCGAQNWTQPRDGSPASSRGKASLSFTLLCCSAWLPPGRLVHQNALVLCSCYFQSVGWRFQTIHNQTRIGTKESPTENCSCPYSILYLSEKLDCLRWYH